MKTNEKQCVVLSRCLLVPYCRQHVLKYHEWMKSEELQQLTASEPLTLEEEYQMQISWHDDGNKCTFIILDREKHENNKADEIPAMVGDVNLFFNDADNVHNAELEIMVAEMDARGKGIGKEAALAMMNYGISTLGVNIYTVKIGYTNAPSIALFQKLGFREVSRSEAFQEITFQLPVTKESRSAILSALGEYTLTEYKGETKT